MTSSSSTVSIFLGTMNIDYPFKSLTSLKCSKEVEEQQNRLILEDYLLKCCDPPPLLDTAYYYAKGQTHRSLRQLLSSFSKNDKMNYSLAT